MALSLFWSRPQGLLRRSQSLTRLTLGARSCSRSPLPKAAPNPPRVDFAQSARSHCLGSQKSRPPAPPERTEKSVTHLNKLSSRDRLPTRANPGGEENNKIRKKNTRREGLVSGCDGRGTQTQATRLTQNSLTTQTNFDHFLQNKREKLAPMHLKTPASAVQIRIWRANQGSTTKFEPTFTLKITKRMCEILQIAWTDARRQHDFGSGEPENRSGDPNSLSRRGRLNSFNSPRELKTPVNASQLRLWKARQICFTTQLTVTQSVTFIQNLRRKKKR